MTESVSIPLGKTSVMIGMPVDNPIPTRTAMSLLSTAYRCGQMGIRFTTTMEISGVVEIGRDAVLDDFLRSDYDKLFWIDSDMVWRNEDFLRLLALSTKVDVVSAAYLAKVEGPHTYFARLDGQGAIGPAGLVPHHGLGLGFTIVSREVCEKLAAKAPKVKDQISGREVAAVFRVDVTPDGFRRTEDMAFFSDIIELGYQPWLDPTIPLGHIGEREWRGQILDIFEKPAAAA